MRRSHQIVVAQNRADATGDGFLTGVKMRSAFDNAGCEKLVERFLEAANEQHLAENREHEPKSNKRIFGFARRILHNESQLQVRPCQFSRGEK